MRGRAARIAALPPLEPRARENDGRPRPSVVPAPTTNLPSLARKAGHSTVGRREHGGFTTNHAGAADIHNPTKGKP